MSFKNAYNGLKLAMAHERNMRIHILVVTMCIVLGIAFRLDALRWIMLVIAVGMVLMAELMNTAVENMVDMVTPEYSEKAKIIKDIAAGSVLIASAAAAVIGILVFTDPLLSALNKLF